MKFKSEHEIRQQQEEAIRRLECAAQFRDRKRHPFWFFLLISALGLVLPVVLLFWHPGGINTLWIWPACGACALLAAYYAWLHASPICPNCKKNIIWARATHCHTCGDPLALAHCKCRPTKRSWFFSPLINTETRIIHCPCCGVWLNTHCYRFLAFQSL